VLVTADGVQVLSAGLPSAPDEVEAALRTAHDQLEVVITPQLADAKADAT
jgi:hypothetical protein